jgi:GH25 family lysozyme M1 (1,4-beta-N-acetylmuramidase)
MRIARHRRAHGTSRASSVKVAITTVAAFAAGALGASCFLVASAAAPATRDYSTSLSAFMASLPPTASPAEGHSPELEKQLSGPLSGTGATAGSAAAGSGARMSTMQQASAAAASTFVKGIDVSAFQHPGAAYPNGAPINWPEVATQYQFAAIKATEGNYYTNPYYAGDAAAATAAGMYVSAYEFANPNPANGTGTVQAQYAATLGGTGTYQVGGDYLPLMLDIEYNPYPSDGNECYNLSPSQMITWISQFVTETETLTGAAPIIYTPANWWDACTGNSTAFSADVLWVPSYSVNAPSTLPAGWNTWTLWQYTSIGSVAGITGDVDLDYFSGAPDQLTIANTPDSLQVETLNALAGQRVTYSATGLPPGLTMSAAGLITGTPTATGYYQVTVTPSASTAVLPATVSFTWDVLAQPYEVQASQQSGFCLDNTGGSSADGNPIQVWSCLGNADQGWAYVPSVNGVAGDFQLENSDGMCLDDPGDSAVSGTKVQLWACLGSVSQQWTAVSADGIFTSYINANGLCLDNTGNATADGNRVQVWACNAGSAQHWYGPSPDSAAIPAAYPVQASQQSGYCLDDTGGSSLNGTPIQIWACLGNTNQDWKYVPSVNGITGDYQLENADGKCLDDPGDSRASGTRVQLWACLGDPSQTWTQTPAGSYNEYVNANGLCLDNTADALTDGNRVQIWACLADPAQQWYGPALPGNA